MAAHTLDGVTIETIERSPMRGPALTLAVPHMSAHDPLRQSGFEAQVVALLKANGFKEDELEQSSRNGRNLRVFDRPADMADNTAAFARANELIAAMVAERGETVAGAGEAPAGEPRGGQSGSSRGDAGRSGGYGGGRSGYGGGGGGRG